MGTFGWINTRTSSYVLLNFKICPLILNIYLLPLTSFERLTTTDNVVRKRGLDEGRPEGVGDNGRREEDERKR